MKLTMDDTKKRMAEEAKAWENLRATCTDETFGKLIGFTKQFISAVLAQQVRMDGYTSFYYWELVTLVEEIEKAASPAADEAIKKFFRDRDRKDKESDPAYQAMMSLQETLRETMGINEKKEEEIKH